MKCRPHTLQVLIKKDMKLMFSNKNIMIMLLLPIGFCLLYQALMGEQMKQAEMTGFVLILCELLNLSCVPLTGLAMMVAEEKEKNTLRVLMLSDVSALEYILSKVVVSLLTMEVIGIFIFFITRTPMEALGVYLFVTTLTSIAILMFGSIVGIISKDQMSTSTLSTPFMILFLIPPMFGQMNDMIEKLAQFIPTTAMMDLITMSINHQSIFNVDTIGKFVIILIWIIGGILLFAYMYKKKRMDN